jgi:hypothetical protein
MCEADRLAVSSSARNGEQGIKVACSHWSGRLCRAGPLPFELADAARSKAEAEAAPEGAVVITVDQDTRLSVRHLDLRTAANQAIFWIQVRVGARVTFEFTAWAQVAFRKDRSLRDDFAAESYA